MANLPTQPHLQLPTAAWQGDSLLDLEVHKEGVVETDKAREAIMEVEVMVADHHQVV